MDRENLHLFAREAEHELASIRSHLLLAEHNGDTTGMAATHRSLSRLISTAEANEQFEFAALAARCVSEMEPAVRRSI
jgi:hypothetical protein